MYGIQHRRSSDHTSGTLTRMTQHAAFYSTINHFPSSSERASGVKHRSGEDTWARRRIASAAVHSASFDAAERGDPPKCHPDTRIAVQDSLAAWRSNRAGGSVRLISGWAGTGKTTIVQTMAEYWAKQGQLAGSFFFSRSSENRSKTDEVPDTILHQFLQIFGVDVDVGHLTYGITWSHLVGVLMSISPSLQEPVVIVIDGFDECTITDSQVSLLRSILTSLDQLGSAIKFLISCRPERHLQDVFDEFAPKLGPSYCIHLGQSAEDNDDIRMFFRASFDRICQHRRKDDAMSLKDGLWPSQKVIEWLVDRASGQFIFAATMVRFVDDENEDPVEMLNLVLEHQTSSFEAIDSLYLVILKRVEMTLDKSEKSLQRRQLMQNLILHVNHEPSSSLAIADFWFEKEVTINILVKHLQALLVRNADTRGQDLEIVVQFRHKSFHDFLARPSAPHSFSLAEMNPVSKFFFSLRTHSRKAAYHPDRWVLQPSQQLGYAFFCCGDHLPVVISYEEEAGRLHRAYIQDQPTFRGCICLPQLEPIMSDMRAVQTFTSCGQGDCVLNLDLLTLCRMMEIPVDHFIREWEQQERLGTILFPIFKFVLWLRVMLYSLLSDPSTAAYVTIRALMYRPLSLSWQARCIAVVNALFCTMVLFNTRWDVVLLLYLSHIVATSLLRWFLRFDTLDIKPHDSSITT
ncbi:hypothetical protein BDN72DRAFT_881796 [Pluteus cervinus]|uniref:Uncharacterized protein n=1 Tax=Pluteus cervinus TaxID=181527 RepID=A0ACD3AF31_9AGAR|nr:hypothetical protein BDN72DRAFT_881796 [Pluteus cervinus]